MATASDNLLDSATINQAEPLGLHARLVVEGYMAGEHKSPFHGFSVEFTQHREYVPGDDIRRIDWKLLGKTDRYYLKLYEQETNYVATILLDGSESMKYGSNTRGMGPGARVDASITPAKVSKLEYGKALVACLSYLILHQRDAVSMVLFDDIVRNFIPRTGNLGSVHNIMTTLAAFNPTQQTSIATVLHSMAGQIKRKGLVILVSDLLDDEEAILDGIQHLRFGGQEVIVFHLMDPYELEFPFTGNVEFEGLEQIPKQMTRPREIRKSYMREIEAFKQRIQYGCEKVGSHYTLVNTAQPLHEVLTAYLAFRLKTTTR
jgi:uncharacterized protein (DUF58 family)